MENKKIDIGVVAAKAGKNASGLFDKAKKAVVTAVDQNADGKLGLDDLSVIRDSVKSAVKDSSDKWNEKLEQQKQEKDLKELRPFFSEDVAAPEFSLPKLIRIAGMDAKHAESAVCKGSIGYLFGETGVDIITIYPENIEMFNLKFYPNADFGLYYVDPVDRDFYISLDDYYNYLKVARISELQRIAQELGATHFRVTYKEQKKSFTSNDTKGNLGIKLPMKQGGNGSYERHTSSDDFSKVEIAAEMICLGHDPVEPELTYFKHDPQIQNLIALRLADNQIKHQSYTLNLSQSSGIKEKDAAKIDAAIKALKIDGNASVSSEAQNESRRIFEYEIDF